VKTLKNNFRRYELSHRLIQIFELVPIERMH
jgi:hypothetical protein